MVKAIVALAAATTVAAAGCGALIGLEDRHLGRDGGLDAGAGGDAGVDDDSGRTTDGGGPDGEPAEASGPRACEEGGAAVLAFSAGDESWRYDVTPAPAGEGFIFQGEAFRLLKSTEPYAVTFKKTIYVRRTRGDPKADYFVTAVPLEADPAYETVTTFFALYYGTASQPPGTVEVNGIVRATGPVRHKLLVGNIAVPSGWTLDGRKFYACPL